MRADGRHAILLILAICGCGHEPEPRPGPAPYAGSRARMPTTVLWPGMETPAAATGGGNQDVAVIIGIQDYFLVEKVQGARRNADAWYRYFVDTRLMPESNVVLLRDADATVESIREAASRAARAVGPGGALWFVFIGHGYPTADQADGLFLGVDVQPNVRSIEARSVSRRDVLQVLQSSRAGHINVVVDACFSGKGFGGRPLVAGLQPVIVSTLPSASDRRIVLLAAASGEQYAGPLPGAPRPAFSYLVLGGLRGWADEDRDGRITAGELYDYAKETLEVVVRDREQVPQFSGEAGTLVSNSAGEVGPKLAGIVETGADQPFEFNTTGGLPTVPEISSPGEFNAGSTPISKIDVDALERLDRTVTFDKTEAPAEEKESKWRELAATVPHLAETANKRAEEWHVYAQRQREAEAARRQYIAARDADWGKLKRLLALSIVSDEKKQGWASDFVSTYGSSEERNPYVEELRPYLREDGTQESFSHGGTLGLLTRADVSGTEGAAAVVGLTYGVTDHLELAAGAVIASSYKGIWPGATVFFTRGAVKPLLLVGIPLFFVDGAWGTRGGVGIHGAAGVQWDFASWGGILAHIGAAHFPDVPAGLDKTVVLSSAGLQLRL